MPDLKIVGSLVDKIIQDVNILDLGTKAFDNDVQALTSRVSSREAFTDQLGSLYRRAREQLKAKLERYRDFELAVSLDYILQRLPSIIASTDSAAFSFTNVQVGRNPACEVVDADVIEV